MTKLVEFAGGDALRKALTKSVRDLDDLKRSRAQLVDAVYQAAHDAASAVTYAPVRAPKRDARSKSPEIAVVALSDFQLGKLTPDYDSKKCAERVALLARKVAQLTAIQRADHPVKEVRVYLLGDLVEGELIFPGQAYRIDASLFRQVMVDGPQILGDFLRAMLAIFETVRVVGVIGNHGQIGGRSWKDSHPETNADSMMYETTRIMLAGEKRLDFAPVITSGERHWFATDTIGAKTFFLFHGNQVKSQLGYASYGMGKKLLGWYQAVEPFDYALSGHFHTPGRGLYGKVTHWQNGSTESSNTYAQEWMAASGTPSQWLLFCSPEHGVSAEYEVHLDG